MSTEERLQTLSSVLSRERESKSRLLASLLNACIRWEFLNAQSHYQEYDAESSRSLEAAYQQGDATCILSIRDVPYQVDFKTMDQRNHKYGTIRKVRRLASAGSSRPTYWLPHSSGEGTYERHSLSSSDPWYTAISGLFFRTVNVNIAPSAARIQLLGIEWVQCPAKWNVYCASREQIAAQNGGHPNEVHLFHGTSGPAIDTICSTHFNRDHTQRHIYGRGVYFARDAAYSLNYSPPDLKSSPIRGVRRMFLARVTLGSIVQNNDPNASAKDKAKKPNGTPHETMVDSMHQPAIYVTTHDAQAYPEFILTFQ
jgi:poly [ADP-ribose] polymerase 10/14/15